MNILLDQDHFAVNQHANNQIYYAQYLSKRNFPFFSYRFLVFFFSVFSKHFKFTKRFWDDDQTYLHAVN